MTWRHKIRHTANEAGGQKVLNSLLYQMLGSVAEWFKAAVLKTDAYARPILQIPLFSQQYQCSGFSFDCAVCAERGANIRFVTAHKAAHAAPSTGARP